ncbi:MAG: hypothetical protein K0S39_3534 [Paenibacillus sp.]|jgi:hypothetical protein|nr:hypothetical protein [Paenibacillus sp.]
MSRPDSQEKKLVIVCIVVGVLMLLSVLRNLFS